MGVVIMFRQILRVLAVAMSFFMGALCMSYLDPIRQQTTAAFSYVAVGCIAFSTLTCTAVLIWRKDEEKVSEEKVSDTGQAS